MPFGCDTVHALPLMDSARGGRAPDAGGAVPEIPVAVWVVAVLYAAIGAAVGEKPDTPLIFRWPYAAWDLIAHAWRQPRPVPRRPNYAKIDRLERELGMKEERP